MATQEERNYQKGLIQRIKKRFPGSIVMKLDAKYKQGIPDWLVLYKDKWATLECKADKKSTKRPNQDIWVDKMNDMSFSSFIYPDNEEEVLNEMERSFKA